MEVRNLQTFFFTYAGTATAVDDVTFFVDGGEIVGVVGESGCGKTVMARSILRLIPDPPGRIVGGEIIFENKNLLTLSEKEMQDIRGNQISMIFQEPMTSLNPVYTVGNQMAEVFRLHERLSWREALDRSVEMLRLVGIPSPEVRVRDYPFQMSGGMRQRVMIAMALACHPKILLADEPTTSLDVTIQAQILDLIRQLQKELNTSVILITHDLGIIAEMVQKVFVMYAGKIVETADVTSLFNNPLHPYTEGLIRSVPSLEGKQARNKGRLWEIPGIVPDLTCLPHGCTFSDRCTKVREVCWQEAPPFLEVRPGHFVRCWSRG